MFRCCASQTDNTVAILDGTTFILNNEGKIIKSKLKKDDIFQAILINIDFERIDSKKLSEVEVIAEEVAHAFEASEVGADVYNKEALSDIKNEIPYNSRPQELRA